MQSLGSVVLQISLVLFSLKGFSQDKIYLDSALKLGKVLDINSTTITYRELLQNTNSVADTKKVILVFNANGNYLVPYKMNFKDIQTRQIVKLFFAAGSNHFLADQIYFTTKKEIEDTISNEDDKYIYIARKGSLHKVDKKLVAAVIYRDGQYKLYSTVPKTADILLSCIQAAYAAATVSTGLPGMQSQVSRNSVEQLGNAGQAGKPILDTSKSKVVGISNSADSAKKTDTAKLTFEDLAGNVSKEEFKKKSFDKIHQFNSYLKILCDKKASSDEQENAVEQAVKLFIDGAIIETSSVNSDVKKHYKVREYLINLENLHYDKIDITWSKVEYVSDIRLGTDGKYYGSISFEQTFRGYRDGELVYEDVTKKTAEVELKMYEKNLKGNTINQWDVLLSDIEVLTTKNL
jgi:hypothetical protein